MSEFGVRPLWSKGGTKCVWLFSMLQHFRGRMASRYHWGTFNTCSAPTVPVNNLAQSICGFAFVRAYLLRLTVTVIICHTLSSCAYLHRALGKVGVEGDAHAAVVVPRARFGLLYGLLYGGYDDTPHADRII